MEMTVRVKASIFLLPLDRNELRSDHCSLDDRGADCSADILTMTDTVASDEMK